MRSKHAIFPESRIASNPPLCEVDLAVLNICAGRASERIHPKATAIDLRAHRTWAPITLVLIVTFTLIGAIQGQPPRTSAVSSGDLKKTTIKKLETIIIPHVEFRDHTLAEAIDFLWKKSVELDVAEPDPARRGVPIGIMKLGPADGAARRSMDDARITVSLSNIPLVEALKYVSALSGAAFQVKPGLVKVVPRGLPPEIITREWKITPSMHRSFSLLKPGADLMSWIIISDGRMPGPTLAVSRDGRRIIGTGTEDEIEMLESFVKSL